MTSYTIRRPYDFHGHLRDGDMLRRVLPDTVGQFAGALIMPNTKEPILTFQDALRYWETIEGIIRSQDLGPFQPLMTIKLTKTTTPEIIRECKTVVTAGKFYPEGMTTNSSDGVRDVKDLYPVFEAMQEVGMVLCLHGETPGVFCMDRETHFLTSLMEIVEKFPKLRVVLEHVTTAAAVHVVMTLPPNVAATITAHHLFLTLDDVVGDMLQPHHFCKPIAKTPHDREILRAAAISGLPKFFLGTDSAPHAVGRKECASGCAGVYTAPVAMSVLAELFEGRSEVFEDFTSTFGCRFYGLQPTTERVLIEDVPWIVPGGYSGVVPFRANQTLKYTVRSAD